MKLSNLVTMKFYEEKDKFEVTAQQGIFIINNLRYLGALNTLNVSVSEKVL